MVAGGPLAAKNFLPHLALGRGERQGHLVGDLKDRVVRLAGKLEADGLGYLAHGEGEDRFGNGRQDLVLEFVASHIAALFAAIAVQRTPLGQLHELRPIGHGLQNVLGFLAGLEHDAAEAEGAISVRGSIVLLHLLVGNDDSLRYFAVRVQVEQAVFGKKGQIGLNRGVVGEL